MVVLSRQTIRDWPTIAIAVITVGVLLRFKVKEPYVGAAGALAGIALHWPF